MLTKEEILQKAYAEIKEKQSSKSEIVDPILLNAMEAYANQDKWIDPKEKPPEKDVQIVATNGNGFFEIIYYDGEKYKKPFAYDEYDMPAFEKGDFTAYIILKQ